MVTDNNQCCKISMNTHFNEYTLGSISINISVFIEILFVNIFKQDFLRKSDKGVSNGYIKQISYR